MVDAMVDLNVEAEKLDRYKADSTGRINLGTEFANKRVEVVVTDVEDEDDEASARDVADLLRERSDEFLSEGKGEEADALDFALAILLDEGVKGTPPALEADIKGGGDGE